MSGPHKLVMPQLGQAMEFGRLAEWLAADGAEVKAGQPIASVESDKAAYEIEAPASGVLRHMAGVGDEIAVGGALATIGDGVEAATAAPTAAAAPAKAAIAAPVSVQSASVAAGRALASPKARGVAESLGVDIRAVAAHRADGLIVAADVEAAAQARAAAAPQSPQGTPLSRLKRTAADRLARSWRQAPHFVQMIEVDASRLVEAQGLMRQGKLAGTLNDLLIKVAADALARHPAINARFADDRLIPFADIGVGLAVAVEEGLTVPVVRGADRMGLDGVAAATRALVTAARENRLSGDQLGGASLTISNLGRYGIAFGTPVLNLDEPVLVFVGAIEERPVGRDGQIVLRPMTTLSVCYDHRVVDGLQAAQFSGALKQGLETLEGLLPAAAPEPATELHGRQLEARSPGAGVGVNLRSRAHAWRVDEPAALGGQDAGPDPVTLALGGLLSCLIIALKLVAQRRRVPIAEVRGRLDATPQGKVKEASITLQMWTPAPEAEALKLLAPAKAACYVHDMLRKDLPISVELQVFPLEG